MTLHLQPNEKILYQGEPDTMILFIWFFGCILLSAPLAFMFIPVSLLLSKGLFAFFSPLWLASTYLTSFIILVIIIFSYHIALRKTYKYYITNERVVFEGGILLRRVKSVPYHKITDVSVSQNILERILGISKLNIHTAGTGIPSPEIQFVGLTDPEMPQSIIMERLRAFNPIKYPNIGE